MTDKVQKIREEVERLKVWNNNVRNSTRHMTLQEEDFNRGKHSSYLEILNFIDSLQEEPVSKQIDFEKELYKAFGQVKDFTLGLRIAKRFYDMGKNHQEPVSEEWIEELRTKLDSMSKEDFKKVFDKYAVDFNEEPVSEDLGEYINELSKQFPEVSFAKLGRIAVRVAKWQKENLWKPADGDDLPEYDREVIVLVKYSTQRNIHDEEYPTYRVGFGHRPNPNGWDGKNIDTNEVTHYTPKLYDKGGWNAPNIVYWLDTKLPYEENKIIK